MAEIREKCIAKTEAGKRCSLLGQDRYGGMCSIHHAKANGLKLPSQYRRKVKKGNAALMLKRFGMQAHLVREMQKTFPELAEINVAENSYDEVMRLVLNCMTMRLIVQPDPKTVEAVTMLSDYLKGERDEDEEGIKVKVNDDEFSLWS